MTADTGSGKGEEMPRQVARFDQFEVDLRSHELRKGGVRVRLQDQPFQILTMLLDRAGDVVTREEIRDRLWPDGTFVDFEHSMNAAIKRLRAALGDTAESPRFVETMHRRGYRFIATVEQPGGPVGTVDVSSTLSRPRLVVLPFANLGTDTPDYFSDGLTEEMIMQLGRRCASRLGVLARTSSMLYKNVVRGASDIGEALRADYLVEGSVLRAGQRLRINIRLIRVRDDMPVWSGQFDRQLIDVFAIHEEISRNIVNNLRLTLGRGRRRYETGTKAYEAYLHARAITVKWGPEDLSESVNLFQDVIAKDPSFVPAYAGLASTQAFLSARREDEPDREVQLAGMRAAAQKAIELDPLLAEAHDALGSAYAREGKWDLAEKSFRRAIQLDPSNGDTRSHFALFLLMPLGRIEEAVGQALVAERNDPLSPRVRLALANTLITARRYNEAAQNCLKLPREHPYAAECLGRARVGQGRLDEAIDILGAASNPGYLGYAYAKAGRRREAEKMAAETRPTRSFELALIFAGLGDTNRTLDALEGMSQTGPARVGRDLNYPQFTFLRGHPRLKAFRSRLGLPQ